MQAQFKVECLCGCGLVTKLVRLLDLAEYLGKGHFPGLVRFTCLTCGAVQESGPDEKIGALRGLRDAAWQAQHLHKGAHA
jgi:hypothetical protein